jgi:hypothetical protein
MLRGPTIKYFLKCPVCGLNALRHVFAKGAAPGYSLQEVIQSFVGHQRGDNGGAIAWTRQPMTKMDMEVVARAVATAAQTLVEYSGGELPDPHQAIDEVELLNDPNMSAEDFTHVASSYETYFRAQLKKIDQARERRGVAIVQEREGDRGGEGGAVARPRRRAKGVR